LHRCSVIGITIKSNVVSRIRTRLKGRVHSSQSVARTRYHTLHTVPNAASLHCRTKCRRDQPCFQPDTFGRACRGA
jgi:hypothetical protein